MTDRVSYLEPRAGFEAGDDLSIQTGGVEGQRQLLRDALKLQLHLGTDFLATAMRKTAGNTCTQRDEYTDLNHDSNGRILALQLGFVQPNPTH